MRFGRRFPIRKDNASCDLSLSKRRWQLEVEAPLNLSFRHDHDSRVIAVLRSGIKRFGKCVLDYGPTPQTDPEIITPRRHRAKREPTVLVQFGNLSVLLMLLIDLLDRYKIDEQLGDRSPASVDDPSADGGFTRNGKIPHRTRFFAYCHFCVLLGRKPFRHGQSQEIFSGLDFRYAVLSRVIRYGGVTA